MNSQCPRVLTEGEETAIDVSRHFSPEVREIISCGVTPGSIVEFVLAMELDEYEPSKSRDYDLENIRTGRRVEVKTDLLLGSTFTSTLKPDKFDEVILVDLSKIATTGCIYARLVRKENIRCFLADRSRGNKCLTLTKYNELVKSKNWVGGGYRKNPVGPDERRQKVIELVRRPRHGL